MSIALFFAACEAPVPAADESGGLLRGTSRLADLLSDRGAEGYAKATKPRQFSFPEDHGPHPQFRNEWWYVTGNLDGENGERFGFELTFFRFSLAPQSVSTLESAWRTNQVYVAHFAITDVHANRFHVAQRYSRGGAGLAGAAADPFRVWLDDWSISSFDSSGAWRLQANGDDFTIELDLQPLKQPVLNGRDGLSQKSAEPGNASYYYSISRLQSEGTLAIAERSYRVSGLSWLDREWSSSALSDQQQGWDWFALQLSNGSEFMFYQIRRNDGSIDLQSAGTWIDSLGNTRELEHDDVSIVVTNYWNSGRGGRYPAAWQIAINSLDTTFDVVPVMPNQELITNVRYWEGAVDVSGTAKGQALAGRGYVELTGYAAD